MNLKQKNRLLFIGLILLFWICYKIPIHQTIKVKSELRKLVQDHQLFANIPQQVVILNVEKVYLDSILAKYQLSSDTSFQSNLLQSINSFSNVNNLSVITFDEPHTYKKNETSFTTFSFSVRGNYINSLKLIHELEQVKKLGKILSVNFERKKNYRTNKKYLETTILLQRLNN